MPSGRSLAALLDEEDAVTGRIRPEQARELALMLQGAVPEPQQPRDWAHAAAMASTGGPIGAPDLSTFKRGLDAYPAHVVRGAMETAAAPRAVAAADPYTEEGAFLLNQAADEGPLWGLKAAGAVMGGGVAGVASKATPSNSLGMFGGRMAKTADQGALYRAQKMASEGADRQAIWNETGWFQGPDKKWRFEIDDSKAELHSKALDALTERGSYGASQRSAVGTMHHDPLYAAYPPLRQIDVDARYNSSLRDYAGRYENPTGRPKIHIEANALAGPDGVPSLLLHELQHPIQHIEGFARGANLTSRHPEAVDAYLRAAGEVEARNVQTRRDMTPEQRRERPPWETQDVPDSDVILGSGPTNPHAALLAAMASLSPDEQEALLNRR